MNKTNVIHTFKFIYLYFFDVRLECQPYTIHIYFIYELQAQISNSLRSIPIFILGNKKIVKTNFYTSHDSAPDPLNMNFWRRNEQ